MPLLTIVGNISAPEFHEARLIAEDIIHEDVLLKLRVFGLLELDWMDYLQRAKHEYTGAIYTHNSSLRVMVLHSVYGYIGGVEELVQWAHKAYNMGDPRSNPKLYAMLQKQFQQLSENRLAKYIQMKRETSKFVYLDISFGDEDSYKPISVSKQMSSGHVAAGTAASAGAVGSGVANNRIVIELFAKEYPKTTENFVGLCTGEYGTSKYGTVLHYCHTPVHRIVKDTWIQMGDIISGKGNTGESIYGPTFGDECMVHTHADIGYVAMANQGIPHTNNSQFYITMKKLTYLDGKRVVFGRVISGYDVLRRINNAHTQNERPVHPILISGCGIFDPVYDPTIDDEVEESQLSALAECANKTAHEGKEAIADGSVTTTIRANYLNGAAVKVSVETKSTVSHAPHHGPMHDSTSSMASSAADPHALFTPNSITGGLADRVIMAQLSLSKVQSENPRKQGRAQTSDTHEIPVNIFIAGLQGAGKTVLVNALRSTPELETLPTRGFETCTVPFESDASSYRVTTLSMGGDDLSVKQWDRYYYDVHAFVFVVKAWDRATFAQASATFAALRAHPMMANKPFLVVVNTFNPQAMNIVGDSAVTAGSDATADEIVRSLGILPSDVNALVTTASLGVTATTKSIPASSQTSLRKAMGELLNLVRASYASLNEARLRDKEKTELEAQRRKELRRQQREQQQQQQQQQQQSEQPE